MGSRQCRQEAWGQSSDSARAALERKVKWRFGFGLHDSILRCPHYSHRARLNPQGSSSKTPEEEGPGSHVALLCPLLPGVDRHSLDSNPCP